MPTSENIRVPIVCFVGTSKSGKTTTIEGLLKVMNELSVGTVKFIHHERMDLEPEGKDTRRHREAGAAFTLALAPSETALLISREKRDDLSILEHVMLLGDKLIPRPQLIISEGPRSPPPGIPVILTAKDENELVELKGGLPGNNPILAIMGVIANSKISSWNGIPVILNDEKGLSRLKKLILSHFKM